MMSDEINNLPEILYSYIADFDKEIYANEERREDSLIQQATNMQTAFSFVSAAVFMVAQIAIDDNRRASLSLVFFFTVFFNHIRFLAYLSILRNYGAKAN